MRMFLILFPALMALAEGRLALEGLDPVLLIEGRDAEGKESLKAEHGGFVYYFASGETRARFQADPERYGIQRGGACARMGAPTAGDPAAYHVHNGRIYIFGSTNCYQLFRQDPAKYLESGGLEWNPTPGAADQGVALWNKTLAAMGGAERWRAAAGLVEKQAGQVRTFRGADALREDRGTPERPFQRVITADDAYSVFQGQAARTSPALTGAARRALAYELFPLLRGAAPEVYTTGEREGLQWVRLRTRGAVLDAGIEIASGRLVRLGYAGRGPGGEAGRIEISYSDFRPVGGLSLPYHLERSFNGEKQGNLAVNIESYELNPADLDARFSPPPSLRQN